MQNVKRTLVKAKLLKTENIFSSIYRQIYFIGDICKYIKPMQFCSIYTGKNEMILPRPISIFDVDKNQKTLEIIFSTVGNGTKALSEISENAEVSILLPLGNGFDDFKGLKKVALVGGGIGIPPLHYLAKELKKYNHTIEIDVYLGYRDNPFLLDNFAEYNVYVASDNSNEYFKGNVVELMKENNEKYDKIISCGPTIMLKSLTRYCLDNNLDLLVSLEERMGCSIGACVGCVVKIKTNNGIVHKKVCVDGPIFDSKVVAFDE